MEKLFRDGGGCLTGGQVYGADEKVDIADLRYSTGLSAAWISSIRPLVQHRASR